MKIELNTDVVQKAIDNVMNQVRYDTGMTLKECYEKQIPKEPVIRCDSLLEFNPRRCPVCDTPTFMRYCGMCGQRLVMKNEVI